MFTKPFELIVGPAGCGKTFAAKQHADENPDTILTATTGIAATNMGAGTTINSVLSYKDLNELEYKYTQGYITNRLSDLLMAGIRRIIIDETSMLAGEQLDIIVKAVDEVNTTYRHSLGGISLTLISDFSQLSPVKGKFAFEADCWERFESNTTKLTKIHRQADRDFIEALRLVRAGKGKSASDYFTTMINKRIDNHFNGTTVVPYNADVTRMNQKYMDQIDKPYIKFKSTFWGQRLAEWDNIPEYLLLKEGALVMILANRRTRGETVEESMMDGHTPFEYVNGDLGILVGAEERKNTAYVQLHRTGDVKKVIIHTMKNIEYKKKKKRADDPTTSELGRINYVPIRIAYSSTVHKVQSLSLDNVQVDFRKQFCGYPGMMYVALSRARTPEGLRLVGTDRLFMRRVNVDRRVLPWL